MVAALNQVRASESLPELPYEGLKPYVSGGTPALLRLGFGLMPDHSRYEVLRERFLSFYESDLSSRTVLYPQIAEMLEECEKTGVLWGIVTNKPECLTVRILEDIGVKGATCVIGGDTLTNRKPHPEPVLHACAIAGIEATSTVMIGDAERDIRSAQAAGTYSIAVTYGYIPPDEDPNTWGADEVFDTTSQVRAFLWP